MPPKPATKPVIGRPRQLDDEALATMLISARGRGLNTKCTEEEITRLTGLAGRTVRRRITLARRAHGARWPYLRDPEVAASSSTISVKAAPSAARAALERGLDPEALESAATATLLDVLDGASELARVQAAKAVLEFALQLRTRSEAGARESELDAAAARIRAEIEVVLELEPKPDATDP